MSTETTPPAQSPTTPCSSAKPRRRVEITIQIGSDSIKDLVCALYSIATDIDHGSRSVVSGGPNSGWHYGIDEDKNITHDSYFAAVDAHLASRKNAPVLATADTKSPTP